MPAEAAVIPVEPVDLMPTVERAEAEGERVIVTRDGKAEAAVRPIADAEALGALEDVRGDDAVRAALAAYVRQGKS